MKKKVLFIDRDGTLVKEPPVDYQLDSLEKLEYVPGVFRWLSLIAEKMSFEIVMVTNQDGLGTDSFSEDTFWPTQNKIIEAFENENIEFKEVLIDKSFPHENLPTRKPGTALLTHYMTDEYDLANSFVIGDRASDIRLAKNLGAKGILIKGLHEEEIPTDLIDTLALKTDNWKAIFETLRLSDRSASVHRKTKETDIKIDLQLDGTGKANISTGLGFFDHMLEQLARHGGLDIDIQVKGDLEIDEHHTIEDTGLALGEAMKMAIGDKLGMERYGYCLPMDDILAQVALDFGGRPWIVWDADFKREKIGDMPTEMFFHFFKSFSDTSLSNINIQCSKGNEHHMIEGIFKAWAKAIKMALRRDAEHLRLPSTKGVL